MKQIVHIFYLVWLLTLPAHLLAQSENPNDLEQNLLQVLELRDSLKEQLSQKQKELRSPQAAGRQEELENEVRSLSARIEEVQNNFNEIALGVDLSSLSRSRDKKVFSWSDELRELLGPLISEMRDLTSRPREISRLKDDLALYKQQKKTAEQAEQNLQLLGKKLTHKSLEEPIGALLAQWESRLKSLNADLAITEEKLNQKMAERKSFSETLESFFSLFFESRGRNLLVAFIVAILVWVVLRHSPRFLLVRLGERGKRLSKAGKIVQVVGLVTSTVGAVLAFLGMLYLFEDWVLLLIFSLLFLGLLWTMKDTLPELWQQLALLLNLGPVREGERVEVRGLPWLVQTIGFYCYLKNNSFSTGRVLRLPIQDLMSLRSRHMRPDEKLFPTKEGDYVTFYDGIYGKITFQSPDYVEITGFGGSKYYVNTIEFLAAKPRVLSDGFGEQVTFGVDYQHQEFSTEVIPSKLKERIQIEFDRKHLTEQVDSLQVEFKEAGASSLDIAIVVEFKGEAAGRYLSLPRIIQRACVEACNENGWVIPFGQLTVHMASQEEKPAS
ncbi:MAG: hypothetical protein KDD64_01785 [Bdellovibrionales bacterium]|nr:hypothetical protein [Bdellovibrionales bacterium]